MTKHPKDMTFPEWLNWSNSCKHIKPVRGGAYCAIDKMGYRYCDYHHCPERGNA